MQAIGLLLFGIGLLAWPRLHPMDSRRRLLLPAVLIGFLMALLSFKQQVPAAAHELPPVAVEPPAVQPVPEAPEGPTGVEVAADRVGG